MKILFLVCTCNTYNFSNIYIDRPDLTRKLSCMETWVPRVIEKGHEVVFYTGDNETEYYDELHHHLYLTVNDEYDYGFKLSPQFEKMKVATKWLLNNMEFDYIYSITDSDYINAAHLTDENLERLSQYDFLSNGSGGEGFFLSKKACDVLINDPHVNAFNHSDIAIDHFFKYTINGKYDLKMGSVGAAGFDTMKSYILAETSFITHYCNGERMYWADYIMSNYSNGNPSRRKIAFNLPINGYQDQLVNTYDTVNKSKTPLFYSFTTDKNGWEHFGGYTRSDSRVGFQFGKESIYKGIFIDYWFGEPSIVNFKPSVQKDGFIIFYFEKDIELYEAFKEYLIKYNVDFTIEHDNVLDHINIEESFIQNSGYSFTNEYIKITNG